VGRKGREEEREEKRKVVESGVNNGGETPAEIQHSGGKAPPTEIPHSGEERIFRWEGTEAQRKHDRREKRRELMGMIQALLGMITLIGMFWLLIRMGCVLMPSECYY
jgi:hypothetical protein